MLDKNTKFLRFSRIAIIAILFFTLLSFYPLSKLKFSFDLERLFPVGDPELEFFQNFKQQFKSEIDDEFIVVGLKNNQGIFHQDFLKKADSLATSINELENIISVYSLTNLKYVVIKDGLPFEEPIIHISNPELYYSDSVKLFSSTEYRDLFISKKGNAIAISGFNVHGLSDEKKDKIISGVEKRIEELKFDKSFFVAKIRVERTYVNEIEKNLKIYLLISLFIICLTLYVTFRSFKEIFIPLLLIVIAVCWTLAAIAISGNNIDIISSLIPPVLAVICMSDIIHIYSKYLDELRKGIDKKKALINTYKDIGLATFFTSFTTAIGFFSLSITNIIPIRLFGIFAGFGVMLAFVTTLIFLFAVYYISPAPKISKKDNSSEKWLKILASLFRFVIGNKLLIIVISVIITASSLFLIQKIQINSSLLLEIPKNNPILEDYKSIEDEFAGTRPFELAISVVNPKDSMMNLQTLQKIESVENYLRDSCKVGFLISPLSMLKGANKALSNGNSDSFALPKNQEMVNEFLKYVSITKWRKELDRYYDSQNQMLRISGKLPDLSIIEFQALQHKFNEHFRLNGLDKVLKFHMTGSGVLLDQIAYHLIRNLLMGLMIGMIVISLIAGFMFKSWRMIFIALIPNIIPLLVMAAVMALLGVYLKSDTSVIFSIAFGIAVDDTIHFLSRFKIEMNKGRSVLYAIKRTYLSTGKALIITTLVLLGGFSALLFSTFGGTFYIGLLITTCLAVALIFDMILLPVLLLLFYKKPKQ